jgi:putative ABC transport system permease protein
MDPIRFSWVLTRRDWRAGELRLLAAALVVAVAAIASVGFFVDRMKTALNQQARQLLGADLVVASEAPLAEAIEIAASARGLQLVHTVSFPSMAVAEPTGPKGTTRTKGEARSLLASIKAVSAGYPLRGTVRTAERDGGPDAPAAGKAGFDAVRGAGERGELSRRQQHRRGMVDQPPLRRPP